MKPKSPTSRPDQQTAAAFTLTELLVVVGVLAILAMTLLPALGRSQPNAKAALCQSNLKQLVAGWQMYPEDCNGRIVANYGGTYIPPAAGLGGWVTGWLDWTTSSQNTNLMYLTDLRYASLSPYLRNASNVFKCPADNYRSASQRMFGWQRVRSYSLNAYLGENTPPGQSPSGLGNYLVYKQIKKVTEFLYPAPDQVAAFLDEHPDSINDPAFWSPNIASNWPDYPATYHNGAAVIAFADGRVEAHKWKGSLTVGNAAQVRYVSFNNYPAPAGDPDISWMSYHTPRVSNQSF